MGPRPGFVRRDANGSRFEKRRVGDDAIGCFVGEPGLAPLDGPQNVEPEDADARLKAVPRGVDLGEPGEIGIDLDQIGERPLRPLRQRQPDRADSRADVGDPAGRRPGRRNEQGGVRADPMAAFRLDEGEPAAEPAIDGERSGDRIALEPGRRLRHRAVPLRGPPRR